MTNLSELDASEFFDVYRLFVPGATREEFDREWAEFQRAKAAYREAKRLQ